MSATDPTRPPLDGLRVLDLTMLQPGPFATQLLADLGARVIKVERPPLGDYERARTPEMFRALNRGKHSIVADLTDGADRDVILGLVPDAHVVVEGFRPGAANRLGFGYDDLVSLRSDLVYVSINAFGSTGPRAQEKGYDTDIRALTGELHFNRDRNGKPVFGEPAPIFDYVASLYAVIGLLTVALRDGHGPAHIEVPIQAAGLAFMFPRLYEAVETPTGQWGADPVLPAADGKYLVTLAILEDHTWKRFCEVIDRPDLGDREELSTFRGRLDHVSEVNAVIATAMSSKTRDEWVEILLAADVPVAPVLDAAGVFADPQVRHLDLISHEPVSARPPIFGIGFTRQTAAVALDGSGAQIRARGWAAVDGPPRRD